MREKHLRYKRIYEYLFIPMILTVIAMIIIFSWLNYIELRDTIILQEQQNLLTIAKTVAKSLELFSREQAEGLRIISTVPSFQQQFKRIVDTGSYRLVDDTGRSMRFNLTEFLYKAQKNDIEAIQIINQSGHLVDQYPPTINGNVEIGSNLSQLADVKNLLQDHQAKYGIVYFEQGQGYISYLEPIFYEDEFLGMIRITITLDSIYKRLIEPIRAGQKGYASIKDQQGVLLMHPKKEDIGKNVIEVRKAEFPQYDWSELEQLVEKQKRGESGVGMYHSIWYFDKDLRRVQKFNAFYPAWIGDGFWIVNVSMDYLEILNLIRRPLYSTVGFALFVMLMLGAGLYHFGKLKKEKEKLEVQSVLIYQSRLATMGEMIANIAHQWRQPLSSLGLILVNIKDAFDYNSLNQQYMDEMVLKARTVLQKMSDTIDDFRFFFNPQKTKEHFAVYENIVRCLDMIEEQLRLNTITVKIDGSKSLKIYGYGNQFSQVIFNIINNAVDALLQNQPINRRIQISIFDDEKIIHIEITNNGGRIPEELMGKIFDLHFTTKQKNHGSGLGLYMSRMIMEKNFNGQIELLNVSDGVTAVLRIPKHGDDSYESY